MTPNKVFIYKQFRRRRDSGRLVQDTNFDFVTPQSTTQIVDIVLPVNNLADDSIGSSLMWKANYTGYTKRSA